MTGSQNEAFCIVTRSECKINDGRSCADIPSYSSEVSAVGEKISPESPSKSITV